ncbi:hypothetical protein Nepgr_014584 [Nepenthes gracilis]|uniref:Uncharacterized protein n=1 Tax=Nepenthes gracilis TaxID=150966 RepID=A0AAD3SK95_NEPGR|nr:hypothetical protein Nepgr_014584 [Nepenthes gracilis]
MEYEDDLNQQGSTTKYDCLLFDLDDTLYPYSSGIAGHITSNIQEYMSQKLGVDQSKVVDMCYVLYKYYGTTLAGLRAIGYHFDYDDYHGFVHGTLPYELLKPDPVLRNLLLSFPIRKVVFTNSDKAHTYEVLGRLGLEDCFDGIICFETLNTAHRSTVSQAEITKNTSDCRDSVSSMISGSEIFDIMEYSRQSNHGSTLPKTPIVCKPFEEAFEKTFKIAEINPHRTLFFDDSVRNLLTSAQMGLHTVLVGKSERPKGVDFALECIHNIKEAFPELLEAEDKSKNTRYSQEVAIETSVIA